MTRVGRNASVVSLFMSASDRLVANARRHADTFSGGDLPTAPKLGVAIVCCMDSRIDLFALFGLEVGEAHLLRNGGGTVTDDVVRSLAISQRKLGTREIILVHHTKCGMLTMTDDSFRAEIEADTGRRPTWAVESFTDPAADVRQSIARIKASPYIPYRDEIRGFVYDVADGTLSEVH